MSSLIDEIWRTSDEVEDLTTALSAFDAAFNVGRSHSAQSERTENAIERAERRKREAECRLSSLKDVAHAAIVNLRQEREDFRVSKVLSILHDLSEASIEDWRSGNVEVYAFEAEILLGDFPWTSLKMQAFGRDNASSVFTLADATVFRHQVKRSTRDSGSGFLQVHRLPTLTDTWVAGADVETIINVLARFSEVIEASTDPSRYNGRFLRTVAIIGPAATDDAPSERFRTAIADIQEQSGSLGEFRRIVVHNVIRPFIADADAIDRAAALKIVGSFFPEMMLHEIESRSRLTREQFGIVGSPAASAKKARRQYEAHSAWKLTVDAVPEFWSPELGPLTKEALFRAKGVVDAVMRITNRMAQADPKLTKVSDAPLELNEDHFELVVRHLRSEWILTEILEELDREVFLLDDMPNTEANVAARLNLRDVIYVLVDWRRELQAQLHAGSYAKGADRTTVKLPRMPQFGSKTEFSEMRRRVIAAVNDRVEQRKAKRSKLVGN